MKPKSKEKSKQQDSRPADNTEQKAQEGKQEELHEKIESLQKEKDELFAQLQRVSADYTNFQKRISKQISDSIGYEKESIIKTFLPVLDNFEHTLQNVHSAENVDVLIKGIRIIYGQFLDILKSHNVEQIEALGEIFDPSLHQAMRQHTDSEKEQDIVLEEFQKGYKLNGRVIRPSRVVINKLPEEKPGEGGEGGPPQEPKDESDAASEYESTDTESL